MGAVKKGIAETYVVVRNICAILMLAGLIFTGIRVLVSANIPNKRAEWMKYLQDWLIGIVLLIFSHIIMILIFYVSDTIVEGLRESMFGSGSNLNWELVKRISKSWEAADLIVCIAMLGYMIYLTVIFTIAYFKRLLWVCVLIVIAPIVSIMYAFGNQTKQIYSKWLREYIMTVFVQPFHMIVYYTLYSVPLNMVEGNSGWFSDYNNTNVFTIIYALGAITFIRPAENYVKKLFGMDHGLANMASYDSGKQTYDTVRNVGKDFAEVGVAVAGAIATDGATAPQALQTLDKTNSDIKNFNENALGAETSSGIPQEEPEWSYSSAAAASGDAEHSGLSPSQIADKEMLEEQIADGQITESELKESINKNDTRRKI